MLNAIYYRIKSVKPLLKQSTFFDYVVPTELTHVTDNKTKEKYVRKMPKKVAKYYIDSNFTTLLTDHLSNWCYFLGAELPEVMATIIDYFREKGNTNFSEKISSVARFSTANTFFYGVFRYCLTHDENFNLQDNANSDAFYLEEFNRIILQQYGVSGRSGNQIIMQLAKSGTQNPYILFEAAEIEYTNPHGIHLEKAYEYYKRASDLGYALADWSLGYLAQKSYEKPWHIKAYDNMSEDEKIECAISYYKKASKKNCSRALNSLGNLASNSSIFSHFACQLEPAKKYYQMAAEQENIDGMYNYARTLEKELLKQYSDTRRQLLNTEKDQIMSTCSLMLTYYKKAADLGKANACYRCALYYGHITDEDNSEMKCLHFGGVECNISTSIRYLEKAILLNEEPIFDAYLFLTRYILDYPNEFFDYKQSLLDAEHYISFLTHSKKFDLEATSRQKVQLEELKYSLQTVKKELRRKKQKTKLSD